MEKVGEIFKYKGVKLQVIETPAYKGCKDCYFQYYTLCKFHCVPDSRTDKKNIIFKEIKSEI